MTSGRFCRACDYDLAASGGPVCPECGRGFSPGDPKSYRLHSRRSWRGRWRRWRWVLVVITLLAAVWPRGWVFTRITWTDPSGSAVVSGDSLVIGHPWWLGGWYGPITWGASSGSFPTTVKAADTVKFTDELWLCDSPWPWRWQMLGRGQLGVLGPQKHSKLSAQQWQTDLGAYVKRVAAESCAASAREGGMSISAPVPPWIGTDAFTVP